MTISDANLRRETGGIESWPAGDENRMKFVAVLHFGSVYVNLGTSAQTVLG
jgi:hypothetical protein